MDSMQALELGLRVMHRHGDEWIRMERRRPAHDPAANDPERHWGDATIYACSRCDDQVSVVHEGEQPR